MSRRGYVLDKETNLTMEGHCMDCPWTVSGMNVGGTSATHAGAHSHKVVLRRTQTWIYDGRNQP